MASFHCANHICLFALCTPTRPAPSPSLPRALDVHSAVAVVPDVSQDKVCPLSRDRRDDAWRRCSRGPRVPAPSAVRFAAPLRTSLHDASDTATVHHEGPPCISLFFRFEFALFDHFPSAKAAATAPSSRVSSSRPVLRHPTFETQFVRQLSPTSSQRQSLPLC
jgi:hypothetical protein